jgi:predicted transcriptional regulator
MKVRTSITLSEELLKAIDERAAQRRETRFTFIEAALRVSVKRQTREGHDTRDLEIINERADFLNREARDVLEYCHG